MAVALVLKQRKRSQFFRCVKRVIAAVAAVNQLLQIVVDGVSVVEAGDFGLGRRVVLSDGVNVCELMSVSGGGSGMSTERR